MNIEIKEAYSDFENIKTLFEEYTASIGIDLSYQNYAEEFSGLPGKYAKPNGRLYIAFCDGIAAGCIGLRKLDDQRCELKRLYVRSQFQGLKIGKRLTEKAIVEAKSIGYQFMLLDTLSEMERARALYKKLGFVEILPYYESPIKDTLFLCLAL